MHKNLSQLKIGESATIVSFEDSTLSLKLLEMGLLPGTEVTLRHIAPLGDPIAIDLHNYLVALRKDEAQTILIQQ